MTSATESTATGIRTRVSAVRGRRPSPLDDSGRNRPARVAQPPEPSGIPPTLSNMRSYESRAEILRLVEEGINDCEISRRTGVLRTTVRDIRRPRRRRPGLTCPRCWRRIKPLAMTADRYAELLGLYLGDGCISRLGRTHSLRFSLDAKYAGIVTATRELMTVAFPDHHIGVVVAHRGSVNVVQVYSSHLPCLFPQHGAGRKHERPIVLEAWQLAHVDATPWPFLRGCFRSDGCAFINRTGRYAYLSYDFTNLSAGILDLYAQACETVGVEYRRYARRIRIYRRASVALFERHVGVKF